MKWDEMSKHPNRQRIGEELGPWMLKYALTNEVHNKAIEIVTAWRKTNTDPKRVVFCKGVLKEENQHFFGIESLSNSGVYTSVLFLRPSPKLDYYSDVQLAQQIIRATIRH